MEGIYFQEDKPIKINVDKFGKALFVGQSMIEVFVTATRHNNTAHMMYWEFDHCDYDINVTSQQFESIEEAETAAKSWAIHDDLIFVKEA